MPKVPITLNAQTLSAEMAAKPGQKDVRAMATVAVPKDPEGELSVATRFVILMDCSFSTDHLLGEGKTINHVMKAAACGIVDLMQPGDEVIVAQFDSNCDILCEPIACDREGMAEARMAINSIEPRGGTDFGRGLAEVKRFFPVQNKNSAIIFVSDGEDGGSENPLRLCEAFRSEGVTVYTACVNTGAVGNAGEKLLSEMAANTNFKSAKTPGELVNFFQTVLKVAQKAALTGVVLEFRPIKFVTGIQYMELVTKNGVDVYLPGSVSTDGGRLRGQILIDQIGPGDKIECHISFSVNVPSFADGFTKGPRSFGSLVLIGGSKSLGIAEEQLARCDMDVFFSTAPARATNRRVQAIIGIADGKRAQFQVQNETDPDKQREILKDAAQKVRGTMALTGEDPILEAVLAGLGDLESTASQGADAVAKKARTGTQVLRADDADAALAGLE